MIALRMFTVRQRQMWWMVFSPDDDDGYVDGDDF